MSLETAATVSRTKGSRSFLNRKTGCLAAARSLGEGDRDGLFRALPGAWVTLRAGRVMEAHRLSPAIAIAANGAQNTGELRPMRRRTFRAVFPGASEAPK